MELHGGGRPPPGAPLCCPHFVEEVLHFGLEALGVGGEMASAFTSSAVARASALALATRVIARAGACFARRAIDAFRDGGNGGVLFLDRGSNSAPRSPDISEMTVMTFARSPAAKSPRRGLNRGRFMRRTSSVALAVWLGRGSLTSEATTAKPRPASPLRAASIVVSTASRLVWPAIAWIRPMHFADAAGRRSELTHRLHGALRFRHGAARDIGRGRGSACDLADRRGELLG